MSLNLPLFSPPWSLIPLPPVSPHWSGPSEKIVPGQDGMWEDFVREKTCWGENREGMEDSESHQDAM